MQPLETSLHMQLHFWSTANGMKRVDDLIQTYGSFHTTFLLIVGDSTESSNSTYNGSVMASQPSLSVTVVF